MIKLQLNNCFWKIWWPCKGPGRSKTRPDLMAIEEAIEEAQLGVMFGIGFVGFVGW